MPTKKSHKKKKPSMTKQPVEPSVPIAQSLSLKERTEWLGKNLSFMDAFFVWLDQNPDAEQQREEFEKRSVEIINQLTSLINKLPNDTRKICCYLQRSIMYQGLYKYEESIQDCENALNISHIFNSGNEDLYAEAYSILVNPYIKTRRIEDGLRKITEGIERKGVKILSKEMADAFYARSQLFSEKKLYFLALEDIENAINCIGDKPSEEDREKLEEYKSSKEKINAASNYFRDALIAEYQQSLKNDYLGNIEKAAIHFINAIQLVEKSSAEVKIKREIVADIAEKCMMYLGQQQIAISSLDRNLFSLILELQPTLLLESDLVSRIHLWINYFTQHYDVILKNIGTTYPAQQAANMIDLLLSIPSDINVDQAALWHRGIIAINEHVLQTDPGHAPLTGQRKFRFHLFNARLLKNQKEYKKALDTIDEAGMGLDREKNKNEYALLLSEKISILTEKTQHQVKVGAIPEAIEDYHALIELVEEKRKQVIESGAVVNLKSKLISTYAQLIKLYAAQKDHANVCRHSMTYFKLAATLNSTESIDIFNHYWMSFNECKSQLPAQELIKQLKRIKKLYEEEAIKGQAPNLPVDMDKIYFELACLERREKEWTKALDCLHKIKNAELKNKIEEEKSNLYYEQALEHLKYAEIRKELGNLTIVINSFEAGLHLRKKEEFFPQIAKAYKLRASVYFDNGKLPVTLNQYKEAEKSYQDALSDLKSSMTYMGANEETQNFYAEILKAWGDLYLQQGKYEGAVEKFEEALRLTPKDASLLYLQGCAYLKMKTSEKWELALKKFEGVMSLGLLNPQVLTHAASASYQLKRYPEAQKYCKQALETDPASDASQILSAINAINAVHTKANPAYFHDLGINDRLQGNMDAALKNLTKAIDLYPNDHSSIPSYLSRAQVYMEIGEREKAKKDLSKILELNKNDKLAHYHLSVMALEDNEVENARVEIRQTLKLDQRFLTKYEQLIVKYKEEKKYQALSVLCLQIKKEFLQKGLGEKMLLKKLNDKIRRAFYILGDRAKRNNNIEEMESYWSNAANMGYHAAKYDLALHYLHTGGETDYKIAFNWLSELNEKNYRDAKIQLARCYAQEMGISKNLEKARQLYKEAAEAGWEQAAHSLKLLNEKPAALQKETTKKLLVKAEQLELGVECTPNVKEALQFYTKATAEHNPHALCRLGKARALGEMGFERDLPSAIDNFRKAIAIDPQHGESLTWLGALLVIKCIIAYSQKEGTSVASLSRLPAYLKQQPEWSEAKKCFEAAKTTTADAIYLQALCLLQYERDEVKAKLLFEEAAQKGSLLAHMILAVLCKQEASEKKRDTRQELEARYQVIAKIGGDAHANLALATFYREKWSAKDVSDPALAADFRQIIHYYKKALELSEHPFLLLFRMWFNVASPKERAFYDLTAFCKNLKNCPIPEIKNSITGISPYLQEMKDRLSLETTEVAVASPQFVQPRLVTYYYPVYLAYVTPYYSFYVPTAQSRGSIYMQSFYEGMRMQRMTGALTGGFFKEPPSMPPLTDENKNQLPMKRP